MVIDRKYFFLSVSLFFKLIINIFVVFYVANKVSVNDFGGFSLAFIISSLIVLCLDYGFNLKGLVLTSKSKIQIDKELSAMVYAKVIITLFTTIFFLFFIFLNHYNTATNKVILILALSAIPNSFGNFFLNNFKIINRFDKEAFGYFIQGIILLMLLVLNELYGSNSIYNYAYGLLIARSVYFLYGYFSFKKGFLKKFSWDLNQVLLVIKTAAPYGIHLILGTSIIYIDTLVLSFLSNLEVVGLYQAGMRIIMASMLISVIISDSFIPEVSKIYQNKKLVSEKVSKLFEFILFFSSLIILVIYFYKQTIIRLLFSEAYLVLQSSIFFILGIILLRYIGIVPGIILTSYGRQSVRAKAVVFSIVASIICNFIFIPIYGIQGAFFSSLIAHIVLNGIYYFCAYETIIFTQKVSLHLLFLFLLLNILLQLLVFKDSLLFLGITGIIYLILIIAYFLIRYNRNKITLH